MIFIMETDVCGTGERETENPSLGGFILDGCLAACQHVAGQ